MKKSVRAFLSRPAGFAILYVILSIGIEAFCMIVFGLRPPVDNSILAPVVLIGPPLLAAWIAGFHGGRLAGVAVLATVLTLGLTVIVTRITRIHTGILQPVLLRGCAGWLACLVFTTWSRRAR